MIRDLSHDSGGSRREQSGYNKKWGDIHKRGKMECVCRGGGCNAHHNRRNRKPTRLTIALLVVCYFVGCLVARSQAHTITASQQNSKQPDNTAVTTSVIVVTTYTAVVAVTGRSLRTNLLSAAARWDEEGRGIFLCLHQTLP